jgi:hypothetical protein
MISYEDFLKEPQGVLEFRTKYNGVFKKDNRACRSLNNTLETEYVAVYRHEESYSKQWKTDNIDWDAEEFYILTAKGKILHHMNSEWGGIGVATND